MFIHADNAFLIVHYYRFDGNYDDWNVWAWPDGQEGAAVYFQNRDGFGATAAFPLALRGATRIGLLLRRSTPDDPWAEKDGDDRYVEELNADDSAEVWIVQGDPRLYFDPDMAASRKSPRIVSAVADSERSATVAFNLPPADAADAARFELRSSDGRRVPIASVSPIAGGVVRLETAEPLAIDEAYVLRFPEYGEAVVSLSGRFSDATFERTFTYDGDDLGAAYDPGGTKFRLWAPTAQAARVVLYRAWDDAPEAGTPYPMERSEAGTWTRRVPGDLDGVYYTFQTNVGGEWREAVDPYAKALAANGLKGAVVDLARTDPEGWADDARPPFAAPTDAVVYELHVRDATMHPASGVAAPGTYVALAEPNTRTADGFPTGLDYVASLGVTHVQLLPVSDFVSVDETDPEKRLYNWGYDPAHFFAPEGSYATDPFDPAARIRELKRLIQAFHRRGIRVVLDVVFNHLFSAARSALERLVPGYYFRTDERGRWSNGTGVGNDTASERRMMRKLIVDCVTYWAKEYHVDGFRFDLMGIHDVETIATVRAALDRLDPTLLVYGEGWVLPTALPEDSRASLPNARKLPRVGFFHDRFRDGVKGGTFDTAERGFVSGEGANAHGVWEGIVGGIDYGRGIVGFAAEPGQTINYVEVHDNHTLWDRLKLSNSDDSDERLRRMHRLASSILLTSQGVPLLHAGQEWFRTKGGEHNSYRSPDAVNRLDWEQAARHRDDIDYVRGLIAMRRAHPAFRLPTAERIRRALRIADTPPGVIAYTLHADADAPGTADAADRWPFAAYAVAHNALSREAEVTLPIANSGLAAPLLRRVLCDGRAASPTPIDERLDGVMIVPPLATVVWCWSEPQPSP